MQAPLLSSVQCLQPSNFKPSPSPDYYAKQGCYRRGSLAFKAFGCVTSKTLVLKVEASKNTSSSSSFPAGAGTLNLGADGDNVQDSWQQQERWRWFKEALVVFIAMMQGLGFSTILCAGNLETIPFTRRTHLILMTAATEKRLGKTHFEEKKAGYKGRILPETHPESIRVNNIAKNLIEALQRMLNAEKDFYDKKSGQKQGPQVATSHLHGLDWEVLMVTEDDPDACLIPGGKIVFSTALLDHFKSDAEIATIIGHEIGHAVARHLAERITIDMFLDKLRQSVPPQLIQRCKILSDICLRLPFCRRMEVEADYIGILLVAAAGYDPRVAPPAVYAKIAEIEKKSKFEEFYSTYPSAQRRMKLLCQAKVMDEALAIYRKAVADHEEKFWMARGKGSTDTVDRLPHWL